VSSVHAIAQHMSEILVVRSSNTTRECFPSSSFASPDSNISRSVSVACSFATCMGSRDDRVSVFALACVWSCDPSGMEENIPLVVAVCGCPQSICIRVRPFGAVLDCIFSVYRDLAINKCVVMFVYERRARLHLAYTLRFGECRCVHWNCRPPPNTSLRSVRRPNSTRVVE
jgi:hypothetical protein